MYIVIVLGRNHVVVIKNKDHVHHPTILWTFDLHLCYG